MAAANESPDWECSSLPDVSADVLEVSLDADASVETEITNEPGDSDNAPKDMEAVRSALMMNKVLPMNALHDATIGSLDVTIAGVDIQNHLCRKLDAIDSFHTMLFCDHVEMLWAKNWSSLPPFAQVDEHGQRRTWFSHECLAVVDGFICQAAVREFAFVPEMEAALL